eukprot:s107_g19.t1
MLEQRFSGLCPLDLKPCPDIHGTRQGLSATDAPPGREDAPPGREEPANVATAAGVEASNSAGEGNPEAVPEKVGAPAQPAEPVEEKKPEVAQSGSNATAEVEAPAQPAEPQHHTTSAAATEEPNVSAEVGGPAPAAEPVEEEKPEATATEGGETSPTAEAVAGPAPSTQPVEEKPEAIATEGGEASPTAEAVAGPAPSTEPVEEKPEAIATEGGEATATEGGEANPAAEASTPAAQKEATAEATPAVEIQQDLSTTEEKQEETERHKEKRKESKEFNWSSLSVATEDVLESLETAVQYTSMAQKLRAKGLIPRAIRMMERALMITQRSELEHPALALEACKVRLNFAAYLSEGYRNREAVKVIKEAQDSLTRLVQWAVQCPPEDLAVQALGREARTLHCSAVVAEAAALDLFEDDGQPPLAEMSEELKETARATSSTLPPDHPLPFLVRKAFGTSAASRTSQRKRSVLKDVTRMTVSNILLSPTAAPAGEDPLPAVTAPPETELPKPETPPQAKNKKRLDDSLSRSKRSAEDRDVFKQYLRDREMARVAHLLSLSDDWEMQTRRKLEEVHRQAKFELELTNVDELKEKRYSRLGHKVYMHQMKTMNKSWSDPNISREAKKDKTAPEIFHLKKLSRKIYVKPPAVSAPAPAPPPKPKVDQALAGSMKALRAEEHH